MRPEISRAVITVLQALVLAAACSPEEPAGGGPGQLETGYWQAQITLPGGHIETAFEIGRDGDHYRATVINGQERIRVGEVRFSDGELTLRFPAYNNQITARLEGGKLTGELTLVKRYGKKQTMPFVAIRGTERNKVVEREPAVVDLSGRWDAEFEKTDGSTSPSIGEFAQRGSRLFGTFLNPTADHRYLSGYVSGNRFHLGTFDGAHAFIFAGTVSGDEIADAHFWSGTEFHQRWRARRDASAALPDAYGMTYLKPGYDRFDFEFPNVDGLPISLSDDKYQGKVVIVMIAGTWCPNCHDETRFLAALYDEYKDDGLEIVGLMYEHFDDLDIAVRQIRKYREKFDIQFETLVAGISDKTEVSRTLPSLSAVLAFPTTIFVGRNGAVRTIHTGFSGPGTGKHHELLKKQYKKTIVELIKEPAGAGELQDT